MIFEIKKSKTTFRFLLLSILGMGMVSSSRTDPDEKMQAIIQSESRTLQSHASPADYTQKMKEVINRYVTRDDRKILYKVMISELGFYLDSDSAKDAKMGVLRSMIDKFKTDHQSLLLQIMRKHSSAALVVLEDAARSELVKLLIDALGNDLNSICILVDDLGCILDFYFSEGDAQKVMTQLVTLPAILTKWKNLCQCTSPAEMKKLDAGVAIWQASAVDSFKSENTSLACEKLLGLKKVLNALLDGDVNMLKSLAPYHIESDLDAASESTGAGDNIPEITAEPCMSGQTTAILFAVIGFALLIAVYYGWPMLSKLWRPSGEAYEIPKYI